MNLLEQLKEKEERLQEIMKLDEELSARFNEAFAQYGFSNWTVGIPKALEEGNKRYLTPSKFSSNFEIKGILKWALWFVANGGPILKQYNGIEDNFKEWDELKWCVFAEKDDKLIVVSNFHCRSELMGFLA